MRKRNPKWGYTKHETKRYNRTCFRIRLNLNRSRFCRLQNRSKFDCQNKEHYNKNNNSYPVRWTRAEGCSSTKNSHSSRECKVILRETPSFLLLKRAQITPSLVKPLLAIRNVTVSPSEIKVSSIIIKPLPNKKQ